MHTLLQGGWIKSYENYTNDQTHVVYRSVWIELQVTPQNHSELFIIMQTWDTVGSHFSSSKGYHVCLCSLHSFFYHVEITDCCIGVTASGIEKVLSVKGFNCGLGLILLSQAFVVAVA